MGQYYIPVNLDKREYIDPHKLNDGIKLLEFGCSAYGTMTALAVLLADGNNRGGGDLHSEKAVIGSWAGDRIVIAGDYADEGKFTDDPKVNLYDAAHKSFKDISVRVLVAMMDDEYIEQTLDESLQNTWKDSPFQKAMAEAKQRRRNGVRKVKA